MQAEIRNYIYDKVKELMTAAGLSTDTVERYDTLVISVIVITIAIAVMEITYRILLIAIRRVVKNRHYNFLTQMLKANRLRKVAHLLVPITLNALLPITAASESIALHYIEIAEIGRAHV